MPIVANCQMMEFLLSTVCHLPNWLCQRKQIHMHLIIIVIFFLFFFFSFQNKTKQPLATRENYYRNK